MVKCQNVICSRHQREDTCKNCQENYIVSTEDYKAKRSANGQYVVGFLVKYKKDGSIYGILNERTSYQELAWIDENTLELC